MRLLLLGLGIIAPPALCPPVGGIRPTQTAVARMKDGESSASGEIMWAPQEGSPVEYLSNTCKPGKELVTMQEEFLPPVEFAVLKRTVLAGLEKRMAQQPAGATRCLFCIHVIFNTAGVRKLMEHPEVAAFYPFFQRARLPDANAFDISVTMVQPSAPRDREAYSPHWDVTLTRHMSDRANVAGLTVLRTWEYGMLSDTSNVIYLQVPADMTGGNFRIWDPTKYNATILRQPSPPPPSKTFGLKENMMVQFRGDALHALDGFQSSLGIPRVSLVIKQYRLSPGDYAFSPEFIQAA